MSRPHRPRKTPTRLALLEAIKRAKFITAGDLFDATGVNTNNQVKSIEADIAAGTVVVEMYQGKVNQRRRRAYRWMGIQAESKAKTIDPAKPAERTCLCCSAKFKSDSAANRICPRCTRNNARTGSGFTDSPAVIRYH